MGFDTRAILEQGNQYAQHQQWANAAAAFAEALARQYDSVESRTVLDLPASRVLPALKKAYDLAIESGPIHLLDAKRDEYLEKLRAALAGTLASSEDKAAVASAPYVTICPHAGSVVVPNPGGGTVSSTWTLVYHGGSERTYTFERENGRTDHEPVAVSMVEPPSYSFILQVDIVNIDNLPSPIIRSARLTKNLRRVAHTWAHLADSAVNNTITLFLEGRTLVVQDLRTFFEKAHYFQVALAIDPQYPWALAHLGETYRNIANGWSFRPTNNFRRYVSAIHYLQAADQVRDKAAPATATAWTRAHLAAAIINVRAFVGLEPTRDEDQEDAFDLLAKNLLPPDSSPDGDRQDPSVELMKKARDNLVSAQETQGFFYPWAQNYHGGALILLDNLTSSTRKGLQQFATGQLLHSLNLQPELVLGMFEPGQLFRNPHLELAILYYQCRKYPLAWQQAWAGLQYLFDFDFIGSVQGLLASMIAAGISYKHITGGTETSPDPGLLEATGLSQVLRPAVPTEIISDELRLADFIADAFSKFSPPLGPFLREGRPLNTKAEVGLLTSWYVLSAFEVLINKTNPRSPLSYILPKFREQIERVLPIETKFDAVLDGALVDQTMMADLIAAYEESLPYLALSGMPGFRLANLLGIAPVQGKLGS